MRCLWPFLLTLLLAGSVFAGEFTGPVVGVLDGDTIEVLHHQRPERIRLKGIDCPEKRQAYGKRAKQHSSDTERAFTGFCGNMSRTSLS